MFKGRRISTDAILRRVKELEAKVWVSDDPAVTFISFQADGAISVTGQHLNGKGKLARLEKQLFTSGPDALDYLEGITHRNPVIIDNMALMPDSFYVDSSLFFCMDQSELAQLYALGASETGYMAFYLDMAKKYAFPGDLPENSILSDLQGCCEDLTVDQLVKRYSDRKWFKYE